jgi:hypothetical protein
VINDKLKINQKTMIKLKSNKKEKLEIKNINYFHKLSKETFGKKSFHIYIS